MNFVRRRWNYLIVCAVIETCLGISYAWSVFQKPIMEQFGWSSSSVSFAFTISIAMGLTVPLAGKLQDYIKLRYVVLIGTVIYCGGLIGTGFMNSIPLLYTFYGVGVGLGLSMAYSQIISYMVKMFPDKRGLASGLMVGSNGMGAVIWAPVGAWLIAEYGVQSAFIILGIVFLVIICVLIRFIGDIPKEFIHTQTYTDEKLFRTNEVEDKTWTQMLKTPVFYMVFLMFVTATTAGLMILGHASPILQEILHMTPQRAAAMVGILAAASVCGKLLWGWLSDYIGRYTAVIILFVLIISALFALAAVKNAAIYIIALLVVELCYGGFVSLIAPVAAENFGSRHINVNYGILFTSFAIGGILGPRLAAVIKEASNGSYSQAFTIAALFCVCGLFLSIFLSVQKCRCTVNEAKA